MRILWLQSDLLLPLDKGGKLRTWHLMRHLAQSHEITYLSFSDRGTPSDQVDGMGAVAESVIAVERRDPGKRSAAFYLDVTRRLLDRLPYAVGKYRSAPYRRALTRLLASRRFDLIVCDFLPPVVNLPRRLPCPAVLFTHNVEAEIWRRHAETARGPVRWLYRTQWRRMLRFEREALARFDGVLAVSDADRETFARLYPGARRGAVDVIPTGVDTTFFTPAASPATSPSLVFTGSMDWLPNEDAMRHFCRDVLPLVRAEVPEATLTIVGRAPTPPVLRLAGPGITVTGSVADVRPFLDASAVFVVPLRIGGGTRLKIFEAMAMGKAVVSTTVGAEGLPVEHGRHLIIADSPADFARAIVRLLRDGPERRALERAARATVLANHDWAAVAGVLDTALRRIAQAPHRVVPSKVAGSSRNGATVPPPVADPATSRGL